MKRKPHLTKALVAGCLTVTAGCQTESAPAPDLVYETRDSAGIPIAVNTGFPSPEDSWVVEAEPFLSIGGASAATSHGAGTGHTRDTRSGSCRVRTDRRHARRRVGSAGPPSGNAGRDHV